MLAERGVDVTFETVTLLREQFGPSLATNIGGPHGHAECACDLDEMLVRIGGNRGHCQFNRNSSQIGRTSPYPLSGQAIRLCRSASAAEAGLVGLSVDEMAFEIEVVADVGLGRGELL